MKKLDLIALHKECKQEVLETIKRNEQNLDEEKVKDCLKKLNTVLENAYQDIVDKNELLAVSFT